MYGKPALLVALVLSLNSCGTGTNPNVQGDFKSSELSKRITFKNQTIGLNFSQQKDKEPSYSGPLVWGEPVEFKYISEIKPPQHPNLHASLQATSMKQIDKDNVAVVYNMAGENIGGAIEIIQFSNPENPRIRGSLVFSDKEFSDFVMIGNQFLLSGNDIEGAIVQIVQMRNVEKLEAGATIRISGHTATSISTIHSNQALITSANEGGVTLLQQNENQNWAITQEQFLSESVFSVTHLDRTWILGNHQHINFFELKNSLLEPIGVLPRTFQDSPARFTVHKDKIYTNASPGLVSIFNFSETGLPLNEVEHFTIPGRGNGLWTNGNTSLFAQGDAGLVWVRHMKNTPSSILGSFDFPNDSGSANQVAIFSPTENGNNLHVLIADGLGGLRWLSETPRSRFVSSVEIKDGITRHYSDVRYFLSSQEFRIPKTLSILAGSGDAIKARLSLDEHFCEYSVQNKKLTLQKCSVGVNPNEPLNVVDQVSLTVEPDFSGSALVTIQADL